VVSLTIPISLLPEKQRPLRIEEEAVWVSGSMGTL